MKDEISIYLNFIKEKGRALSEINPGSDEWGLKIDDAYHAIELIKRARLIIQGGDILSDEKGHLSYTYENWYCEEQDNSESQGSYAGRSYEVAKTYIDEVVIRSGKNRYVVFVVKVSSF